MEEDAQTRLNYQRLCNLLLRYPERERDLVALKYGGELTNREIARLLKLSESNVGTILNRVVSQLRSEWEQEE